MDDTQLLIFSFEQSFVGLCFLKFFVLFIYLTVVGLSCSKQDLHCGEWS